MSNIDTLNASKSIAEHLHLNVSQVQAAEQALSHTNSLAYCYQYALNEAGSLNLAQWYKLNALRDHSGLSARFLGHDRYFLEHFSLTPTLKAFPFPQLLSVIEHVLEHPDIDFEVYVQTTLNIQEQPHLQQIIQDLYLVMLWKLMQQPDFLHNQRQLWLQHASVELCLPQKPQEAVAELQAQWPKPAPLFKKFSPSLAAHFFELKKSHTIQLAFVFAQDAEYAYHQLGQALNWSFQGRLADTYIMTMVKQITDKVLAKLFHRDLTALLYEQAVDSLLPLLELKLKSYLSLQGKGTKPIVLIYPHGRSGVMFLTLDAQGEILDETMIYPYAQDYDAEHTLSHLAKMVVKFNTQDMALIVKPETIKLLLKTLNTLQQRYPDFHLNISLIPGDLTKVFHSTQKKHPDIQDVLHMAHFVQKPMLFWREMKVSALLPPVMNSLPQSLIHAFWQDMVSIAVYQQGIDVNSASLDELQVAPQLTREQAQLILDSRPFSSRLDIQERIGLSAEQCACFRLGQSLCDIEASALLIEDKSAIDALVKKTNIEFAQLFQLPLEGVKEEGPQQQRVIRLLKEMQIQQKTPRILSLESSQALDSIAMGELFVGVITKVMNYGLFVELAKGVEGLLHISAFGDVFVGDLNALFHSGELIGVEWNGYDAEQKRISLRSPGATAKISVVVKDKPLVKNKPHFKTNAKPKPKANKLVVESKLKEPSVMQLAFEKLKGTSTPS